MPIPDGLSWEVHFLFWIGMLVIGTLAALTVWFIKRYIDSTDSNYKKVEESIKSHSAETKNLTNETKSLAARIEREATKIDQAAASMAKTQADFQTSVSRELIEIHKGTVQIKNDLNEGKLQVAEVKKGLDSMAKTIDAHQNSLSLGAKAMVKQREEVLAIKTTVNKLTEDLTLYGQKLVKKGDK